MNAPIPDPLSGNHVIDWAVPVTRALNALVDKSGATVRNERDRRHDRPLPFEVRWDGTLAEGEGGWKIYLPTDHLLYWKSSGYVDLDGVTSIEDANGDPTGWFEFDDIDVDASHIWLTVSEDDSGSANGPTVSAEFAETADAEAKASICIAEVSYTAATSSAPASAEVKQSVVGAIIFGGSAAISASGAVVSSVDYVSSTQDEDFANHAYAIRISRGTLTYDAATGSLSVVADRNLTQYIGTTPHSTSMDS